MGVKFNSYSDEEMCGEATSFRNYDDLACMRTKGHEGDHEAVAKYAGEADGVRFCCRVPSETDHTSWCPLVHRAGEA